MHRATTKMKSAMERKMEAIKEERKAMDKEREARKGLSSFFFAFSLLW